MKVAVMHLGRSGAGPLFALQLAQAIDAGENEVAIIYSEHAEIASKFEEVAFPRLGIKTFAGNAGAFLGTARLPHIAREMRSFLTDQRVDGVVVAMEQVWQGLLPTSAFAGLKVAHFVHDANPHDGEDNPLVRWLRERERRRATVLVALSSHVAQSLAEREVAMRTPIVTTIHPAFTVSTSASLRHAVAGRSPVVGFFGRMSRYKGIEIAIDAVRILREADTHVVFHVVGAGVPRSQELDHPDTIVDDRWVPESEVEAVLRKFDIVLLPYTEASQSGVLAYAAALGIPAVVTPVGGLAEQAAEFGSGVVAEHVSASSVADALAALISDGSLYEALSARALQNSRSSMSWERVASDAITALRTSLDR